MDSTDELSDMAIKNISDILAAQPNEKIEVRMQLHAYDDTAYRYQIVNNALLYIDSITLSGESTKDFIQGAQWGFQDSQSDYTMAILWNHGKGILDPQWDQAAEYWVLDEEVEAVNSCTVKKLVVGKDSEHSGHKGFMFNQESQTYLNNQDLIASLEIVSKQILGDKKLDVLAFDTCMGAMLEVAYQIADYTHYFVGSQSCSLRDGFNYKGVISALNTDAKPCKAVASMVAAFNEYYKQHDLSGIYTHTAIDMAEVKNVCEALNKFLINFLALSNGDLPILNGIIENAAKKSPRFCAFPMYTDLIAFLKNIEEQLNETPDFLAFEGLTELIDEVELAIKKCVVARCGGIEADNKAHGLSVYLPNYKIDSSYFNTLFAQNFKWLDLLRKIENFKC